MRGRQPHRRPLADGANWTTSKGPSAAEADACCIFAYFAGGSRTDQIEAVCCVRWSETRD